MRAAELGRFWTGIRRLLISIALWARSLWMNGGWCGWKARQSKGWRPEESGLPPISAESTEMDGAQRHGGTDGAGWSQRGHSLRIRVIGGGLAGPEAALTAARLGCEVDLYEMRAVVDGKPRLTPAHQTTDFGELVCSNSLKSESEWTRAVASQARNAARGFGAFAHCGCLRGTGGSRSGGRSRGVFAAHFGGDRGRAAHSRDSRRGDAAGRTHRTVKRPHYRRDGAADFGCAGQGDRAADRRGAPGVLRFDFADCRCRID